MVLHARLKKTKFAKTLLFTLLFGILVIPPPAESARRLRQNALQSEASDTQMADLFIPKQNSDTLSIQVANPAVQEIEHRAYAVEEARQWLARLD